MGKRGKPFEKGNDFGKGRPAEPEWVKQTKALDQAAFASALNDICRFSTEHIRLLAQDDQLPITTGIMANWLLQAKSDQGARNSLFDRLYGKPKESFDVTTNANEELLGEIPLSVAIKIMRNKDKLIE